MDLEVISRPHALPLILEVGDKPGQPVRRLITRANGSPLPSINARIVELEEAGVLRYEEGTYCGRAVTKVHLTEKGMTLYNLLCVIRGL